jgi:hypothetical protein
MALLDDQPDDAHDRQGQQSPHVCNVGMKAGKITR